MHPASARAEELLRPDRLDQQAQRLGMVAAYPDAGTRVRLEAGTHTRCCPNEESFIAP